MKNVGAILIFLLICVLILLFFYVLDRMGIKIDFVAPH
jgi:hypothetical protein